MPARVQWLSRVTSARAPQVLWDLTVKVKLKNVIGQSKNEMITFTFPCTGAVA